MEQKYIGHASRDNPVPCCNSLVNGRLQPLCVPDQRTPNVPQSLFFVRVSKRLGGVEVPLIGGGDG